MSIKSAALAHGRKEEIVEIPEWADEGAEPVKVLVKEFTAGEATRFSSIAQRAMSNGKPIPETYIVEMVIATAFDPGTDKPAFDKADRDALLNVPFAPLARIQRKAQELSGMTDDGIEEAEKNSARAAEEPSS